jgi:ABC-2 type transport system ATP-binding protein
MNAVEVSHLKKNFFVFQKEPGVLGSFKSVFSRRYKEIKAVRDISFTIKEGELVGFIGPNGAGKTTTLKCLSGLLHPDTGSVSVLGFRPSERKPELQKQFALVMGQKNQLWWDLPPMETFLLNKEIYGVPQQQFKKTLDELVELLEVQDILKNQVRKLSLGQRMKCELIAALLHSPKVLFLDEPTIGMDVIMQKKIRDFIREYNHRYKATIILTSHYMGDVKELCQRVIIIDKGRLVFDGQLNKIIKRYAEHKILSVILSKKIDQEKLSTFGQITSYNFPEAKFIIDKKKIAEVSGRILSTLPVVDINIEEPPIEEIIRDLFTNKNYQ